MVAEAATPSSGSHCHEESSEKRDLSRPHSPGTPGKRDSPSGAGLALFCSSSLSATGFEAYFGFEMRCRIWTSLLEPRGYLQSLTEESKGTSGTNIRMTRHGAMRMLQIQSMVSPF